MTDSERIAALEAQVRELPEGAGSRATQVLELPEDNLTAAVKVIADQQRTIAQLTARVEVLQLEVDRHNAHLARALAYAARDEA